MNSRLETERRNGAMNTTKAGMALKTINVSNLQPALAQV